MMHVFQSTGVSYVVPGGLGGWRGLLHCRADVAEVWGFAHGYAMLWQPLVAQALHFLGDGTSMVVGVVGGCTVNEQELEHCFCKLLLLT